jgi:imidazolonepropionase
VSEPAGDLLVRRIGRLRTMVGPPVESAAVVVRDGRVAWTGAERALPAGTGELPSLDAGGAAVIPGFVDPHTHLVWAGSRREEFVARLAGERYDGGGIGVTVAATRATSTGELVRLAIDRARASLAHGTTTMEVKTGYGLSRAEELRLLDVIAAVAAAVPLRIEPTYLGAHVVPDGHGREDYVAEVVETLPAARRRGARWCDVFCDRGAFSVDEARRILTAARTAGLGLRLHADQLDRIGAATLAAESGCASADHLDRIDDAGARALAAAGTVGVLLPTATLSTRSTDWGQAAILSGAGVTMALATDCNPGTSWCESMPYVLSLACLGLGMTVEAALRAATLGGAAALRRTDVGHLAIGARGDLAVLESAHEADLVAHLGAPAVRQTVVGGVPV